jgi:hypothetical protein
MSTQRARQYAFLAGMLTMMACWGANWLLGAPPDASTAREAAVVAQVLVSAVLGAWCWRRSARGSELRRDLEPAA